MRSRGGRAGVYLRGYGRMFLLDGRREIWRRPFNENELELNAEHLDPFKVGKTPELYRQRMVRLLDRVARRFAEDLNPPDRLGARAEKPEPATRQPEEGRRRREPAPPPPPEDDDLPPGELPEPD